MPLQFLPYLFWVLWVEATLTIVEEEQAKWNLT